MKNSIFAKTISACESPLSWCMFLLLPLNDLFLKQFWAGLLSGKLSDFAWIYIFPLLILLLLGVLLPNNLTDKKEIGWLVYFLVAVIFVLMKSSPLINRYINNTVFFFLNVPVQNRVDPTDNYALMSLLLGFILWNRSPHALSTKKSKMLFYISLFSFILIADSAMPDFGLTDICAEGDTLFTFSNHYRFHSSDHGITWTKFDNKINCYEENSQKKTNEVMSTDGRFRLRYQAGEKIEQSIDNGKSWQIVYDLVPKSDFQDYFNNRSQYYMNNPGPHSAIYDPTTGSFLFTMGHEGILIRKSTGDWEWVMVGGYYLKIPSNTDRMKLLLDGQYLVALLVSLAVFIASIIGYKNGKIRFWFGILILMGIIFIILKVNPISNNGYFPPFYYVGPIILLIVGAYLCIKIIEKNENSKSIRQFLPLIFFSLTNGFIYLVLFLLWTYWIIPYFSEVLSIEMVVLISSFLLGRYIAFKNKLIGAKISPF